MPFKEICDHCKDFTKHNYSHCLELFPGEYFVIKKCLTCKTMSYKQYTPQEAEAENPITLDMVKFILR